MKIDLINYACNMEKDMMELAEHIDDQYAQLMISSYIRYEKEKAKAIDEINRKLDKLLATK